MTDETSYNSSLIGSTVVNGSDRSLQDEPTESHAMAVADYDDKGAAQLDYDDEPEVKDLGWHEEDKPAPLVAGLSNEQLFTLIRRFNKQMYHIKAIDYPPPGGLDLNISDEEEFSPDKLRSNIERLYMTVIIGLINTTKHIARLRSWNEYRRTSAFLAAYYIAWFLNILSPLFLSTLIALIIYPPSRAFLFPPAPLALVDSKSGGLKKPDAGLLGSHNTLTGAPEKHEGEALEQEAHNFVNSFAVIGFSAAVGKRNQEENQDHARALDKSVPDSTHLTTSTTSPKNGSVGMERDTKHDKTKQPMEEQMWEKARPVMRALADVADVWERFANALSPISPFKETARLRLAGILVPAVGGSMLLNSDLLVKSSTFLAGAIFFSDPLQRRGLAWLNRNYPNWTEYLDPRNHILYGVPTNAQLTLTLLRIGEANKAPLPPPPISVHPPSSQPRQLHTDDVPLDASHEQIQDAIHPDSSDPKVPGQEHLDEHQPQQKHKHGRKVLQFIKSTTRAGVNTVLGTDRLKASVGDENAKMRLGVLPDPRESDISGPVDFIARHHGKKGHLYIKTAADPPCVTFSHEPTAAKAEARTPVFTVPIHEIRELKKMGGLGWKFKFVVSWAMDREVADGLEIVDSQGESHVLTAIPLRDELFNRLIAMGGQKWESW